MTEIVIETSEFFEQIDYGLSLTFREKWRHKYGTQLIHIFQDRLINALEKQKPLQREVFISSLVNKHKYNKNVIEDFLDDIDIGLYRPLFI